MSFFPGLLEAFRTLLDHYWRKKPLKKPLKTRFGGIMAAKSRKDMQIESIPKNTRQGDGKNTKYSATSRNKARKPYRGQGR